MRVLGTERYRKLRLFVATLRYSRRCFRRVVWKFGSVQRCVLTVHPWQLKVTTSKISI